jgi:UDP-N-acetylglucosamine transferase subunit ALG13
MIFISVGTANKGFDRLLKECDRIASRSTITFYAQTGSSTYIPKHIEHKQWLSRDEMVQYYHTASGFIVHGGFGTISEIIRLNKPIIVVPRKFEDGEAVNNQADLAVKLSELMFVKCIDDLRELEEILINLQRYKFRSYNLTTIIPKILDEYLSTISDL